MGSLSPALVPCSLLVPHVQVASGTVIPILRRDWSCRPQVLKRLRMQIGGDGDAETAVLPLKSKTGRGQGQVLFGNVPEVLAPRFGSLHSLKHYGESWVICCAGKYPPASEPGWPAMWSGARVLEHQGCHQGLGWEGCWQQQKPPLPCHHNIQASQPRWCNADTMRIEVQAPLQGMWSRDNTASSDEQLEILFAFTPSLASQEADQF